MMVSVETALLRFKRRTEKWMEAPAVRGAGTAAACFGGGALLSAVRVWGSMQPVAMGLAAGCRGWRRCLAALGSAAGYLLFWGRDGCQGVGWAIGALVLALMLPLADSGPGARFRLAAWCMALVSGTGFFSGVHDARGAALLGVRVLLAGGSALLAGPALHGRDRLCRWFGWGVAALALGSIRAPAGYFLAGLAMAAAPLPAALAVALGAELAGAPGVSLAAAACLSFYLQRLIRREPWRRVFSPGLACGALCLLEQRFRPELLIFTALGGAVGALTPWHVSAPARHSRVGVAQVRLEQAARVLNRFQRQLLEYTAPPPDVPAMAEQLKQKTCAACPARTDCVEQSRMTQELLQGEEEFVCRKQGLAMAELHRSREQLRRIRASRARQEEYRMALVQQYGFLSDMMHDLSDRLPEGENRAGAQYRVKVSARSRGKEIADGDRVSAFPGVGCRYYVALCDGMGTGLGASEQSDRASELIRQMLTAGMTPGAVLGSVNSQLALTDRGGAVTVDLAEIRADTGRVWLYKWGAGPSWLLKKRGFIQVGASGPPPGLGVSAGRENMQSVYLGGGDVLVMASDGVDPRSTDRWAAARDMEPGALAERILQEGGSREDDATVAVIRLVQKDGSV